MVLKSIIEQHPVLHTPSNHNKEYTRACDELRNNDGIICPSEKGRKVVVWGVKDYNFEASKQLESSAYKTVTKTQFKRTALSVRKTIESAFKDSAMRSKLIQSNPILSFISCQRFTKAIYYHPVVPL
ncbi:hypothetical protein GJ496_001157 [Pomphorhynchus laevis]|nr:hypothetical protein GJ496_001157 [Pomphorhynchus laevis]